MVAALNEISIAHSPDSDDAFMFWGLAAGKVETYGLQVKQVLKDIQTLNIEAQKNIYDVTAISFAAYPGLAEKYMLMTCGASFGINYGPIVISQKKISLTDLKYLKLAIPGKQTSAFFTLSLLQPELNVVEIPFDQIPEAVRKGDVDAGLVIHEGQLTYEKYGLVKNIDLGQWWYDSSNGLPLPLGGNAISKKLNKDTLKNVVQMVSDSIKYALKDREAALKYAMSFARDLSVEEADKFVKMYVNELTVDYGEQGKKSLRLFYDMAYEKGLLKEKLVPEFISPEK